jgi:hypothetical protein
MEPSFPQESEVVMGVIGVFLLPTTVGDRGIREHHGFTGIGNN